MPLMKPAKGHPEKMEDILEEAEHIPAAAVAKLKADIIFIAIALMLIIITTQAKLRQAGKFTKEAE